MMRDSIILNGRPYEFAAAEPMDISIPLCFNDPQPNAYGVDTASSQPCEAGEIVGDTRHGGSCNFEQYKIIPHCNGTHTECVGHITNERISVRDCLTDILIPAVLVSVEPELANKTEDSYSVRWGKDDHVLTRRLLKSVLSDYLQPPATAVGTDKALIIRTLRNDDAKLTRRYDGDVMPPYFTTEALEYVVECGFRHMLVDLPSIDRLYDKGKLSNHRIFWNVEAGRLEPNADTRMNSTITELIYVPNDVVDGNYLLNLQIAPFATDASPSRPVIFKIKS
jgi:arylformamidase